MSVQREMTMYRRYMLCRNEVNSVEGGDLVSRAWVAPCTGHLGSPFGVRENNGSI
jgi:hypothetical protein